ncbi:serine hydrolase domain-containing protein [uncultured Flavonifractor sp.]|uniref:serine hydrolase domain-containing protein n=1 Tax=uncultured Flavonifractor sp. TaxID=1193534 RepID=UPI00262D6250|nr:serine hydrolase domain-containing protein [uncultured Flavonifractor sp.]
MKRIGSLLLSIALAFTLCVLPAAATEADPTLADTAFAAAQAAQQYGGAQSVQYALWQDGEIVLTGHVGDYSRTENRALTDDILYGIGSVSKMYTTAAVLKLAEAGKLELDAPVTRYLPDFTMADPRYQDITVRMLLNHSSGLAGSTMANGFLLNDPDTTATDTLLEELSTQRLKADPGAFSVYCNDGFTLAELVVEAVSGMEFDQYVQQTLLEPAGLADTYFPGGNFDASRLAKTYYTTQDTQALPQETVGVHGTGGIYATASDLAAFGGMVFCEDAILNENSRAATMADEYANGLWPEDEEDSVAYGLGWDSVHWYPFAYSGIQALVKGGDTIVYHSGLVVLPEYHMAAAVLSSGGVSTYNEMAASQILIAALGQQGVTVDQTPRTLPAAEKAEMPVELTQYSGLYGSSTQTVSILVSENGTMTAEGSPLSYYSDGSFRDEEQTMMVKFIEEDNGQVYCWQKAYSTLPGLGQLPTSSYAFMKLPDNQVSKAVQSAWDARSGKMYLALNLKYSNIVYTQALPAAGLATDSVNMPGYMVFDRMVDENYAEGAAIIPGLAGRDWQNITITKKNGVEYLSTCGGLYVDSAAAESLFGGASSWSTIQADGYARWYQVGPSAAGKTMTVQLPEVGGFAVYDAAGTSVAASWAFGDTSVVLPEGGWVVFSGDPGSRFLLTLSQAEEN